MTKMRQCRADDIRPWITFLIRAMLLGPAGRAAGRPLPHHRGHPLISVRSKIT